MEEDISTWRKTGHFYFALTHASYSLRIVKGTFVSCFEHPAGSSASNDFLRTGVYEMAINDFEGGSRSLASRNNDDLAPAGRLRLSEKCCRAFCTM